MTKLEKNKQFVINDMDKMIWLKKDKWGNYLFKDDNTLRYHHKKLLCVNKEKLVIDGLL